MVSRFFSRPPALEALGPVGIYALANRHLCSSLTAQAYLSPARRA